MASYTITKRIRNHGVVYCARARLKETGVVTFSKSKTFNCKKTAMKWAKEMVQKLEKEAFTLEFDLKDCTLEELILKYIELKSKSSKPLGRTALYSLKQILTYPIAKLFVSRVRSNDIVNFCLARKKSKNQPSASTISVDVSCLRKVFRIGKSLLGIQIDDRAINDAYPALHDLQLIARSRKRERRLSLVEFEMLQDALLEKQMHHCCFIPYADIFHISILTCCRINEICNLLWCDINKVQKSIIVRDRKNPNGSIGNNSVIPLLGESLDILLRQKKTCLRIFPFNPRSIGAGFRKVTRKLNLVDLRYHDLRREGASRLIEQGYSVEQVARVTGHRYLNVLWQVYVNIRPEHFIEKAVQS